MIGLDIKEQKSIPNDLKNSELKNGNSEENEEKQDSRKSNKSGMLNKVTGIALATVLTVLKVIAGFSNLVISISSGKRGFSTKRLDDAIELAMEGNIEEALKVAFGGKKSKNINIFKN